MSRLKILIDDLKENPNFFKNNESVIEGLEELNSVIGHRKLKDSMCDQIGYIIGSKMNSKKLELPMLNTVLYGPPGVGKSTIGEILAKIWYALDVIEKPTEEEVKYDTKKENNNIKKKEKEIYNNKSVLTLIVLMFILIAPIILILIVAYYYYGYNGISVVISVLILLSFLLYFFLAPNNTVIIEEKGIPDQNGRNSKKNKNKDVNTEKNVKPTPFTIVRREDLIGQYMGHTVDRTSTILRENLGKVIFIDEAYSLITDERDTFGLECINLINQFLTENKGKIIVIFAGYLDKLHNGPFKYQPGLLRRFMWHIECEGYNSEELFKIFDYQVKKKQLSLRDPAGVKNLFLEYDGCFPNYGGDTENLVFFSELKNYQDLISGSCEVGVLENHQVRSGIERMLENNPKKKENNLENLLSNFDASSLFPDEDIINRVRSSN